MSICFKADFHARIGKASINTFIANAGLGITGLYKDYTYTLSWQPGELVDEERARKLEPVLMQALNAGEDIDCSSVKLERIYSSDEPDPISTGQ